MGLIPGMPNVAFLLFGGALRRRRLVSASARAAPRPPPALARRRPPPATGEQRELSWDDVQPVDLLGLEVGYRLVPLVDKTPGRRSARRASAACAASCRRNWASWCRRCTSATTSTCAPNAYRISLAGVPVGEGVVYPDRELAHQPGPRVRQAVQGIATRDPAFGMEAIWIEPADREHAQTLGYTVVDPAP